MKNIRLYLFRHGFTQGNIDKRYIGVTDEPLCEEGKAALCELYAEYKYPTPQIVFSSPLSRCIKSADIMFANSSSKIIIEQLQECNFGEFENKSFDELKGTDDFMRWLNPEQPFTPKGGESAKDFNARCKDTLLKLLEYMFKAKVDEAAVVTHGGVIMSMLAQCALPKKPAEEWMADSGCGFMVQCSAAMLMRDKTVEAVAIVPFGYLNEYDENDQYDESEQLDSLEAEE